jgi:hypothetical protein
MGETLYLTLRKGHRLKVFGNRVLKIYGPKRDEVTGDGETCIMRSFITCTLAKYNWNDKVKEDEMGRTSRILVGKPEGKIPLGRP